MYKKNCHYQATIINIQYDSNNEKNDIKVFRHILINDRNYLILKKQL